MPGPLTSDDFPLRAIGPCVYRRTESSPMFTASDDALAADLVARLNGDDVAGIPVFRTTLAETGIKGLATKDVPDA